MSCTHSAHARRLLYLCSRLFTHGDTAATNYRSSQAFNTKTNTNHFSNIRKLFFRNIEKMRHCRLKRALIARLVKATGEGVMATTVFDSKATVTRCDLNLSTST